MPNICCSKSIANNIKYADILFKMQKKDNDGSTKATMTVTNKLVIDKSRCAMY